MDRPLSRRFLESLAKKYVKIYTKIAQTQEDIYDLAVHDIKHYGLKQEDFDYTINQVKMILKKNNLHRR